MADQSSSNARSPLTAPPLRNPGQSLDEEIHRFFNEDVISYLSVIVCSLVITLMEWWRWWFPSPPRPILFTVLTVAVTAYITRRLFVLRRKVRQLRLARDGERAVADLLTRLDGGGLGLEPAFPYRARLSDPAPLPDNRPPVEQGPGHGDVVEPQPVAGRLAPFEVDRRHHRAIR